MPGSSTRRIRTADIPAMPWKNGGGVTREIATGPSPAPDRAWGWRVSIAEVAQDGPFSIFPETDRVIVVIDGAGMDLVRPDGTILALEPLQPVPFAGEEPLDGRLRGAAVRDLNVMVLRAHFSATMDIRRGPHREAASVDRGECLVIHALAGRCSLREDGGEVLELAPSETLVHDGAGHFDLQLADGGRAAVIRIGRR